MDGLQRVEEHNDATELHVDVVLAELRSEDGLDVLVFDHCLQRLVERVDYPHHALPDGLLEPDVPIQKQDLLLQAGVAIETQVEVLEQLHLVDQALEQLNPLVFYDFWGRVDKLVSRGPALRRKPLFDCGPKK